MRNIFCVRVLLRLVFNSHPYLFILKIPLGQQNDKNALFCIYGMKNVLKTDSSHPLESIPLKVNGCATVQFDFSVLFFSIFLFNGFVLVYICSASVFLCV